MLQKIFFTILFILTLVILGFFIAAFLISRGDEKVSFGEALREVAPFGNLVEDLVLPPRSPLPTSPSGEEAGGLPGTSLGGTIPLLYKISAEPVAGATAFMRDGTEYVRYVLLETGNIYEYGATTTVGERVSNTTAPGVKKVVWDGGGNFVIFRFLSQETTVRSYLGQIAVGTGRGAGDAPAGVIIGTFLNDGVADIVASPDKKQFLSLSAASGNSTWTLSAFGFEKKGGEDSTVPVRFPLEDVVVSWPQDETLVLTTKPSAHASGFSYLFNIKTGGLTKLLGDIAGLTVLPSPDLSRVLYARGLPNRIDTLVLNTKTGESAPFPVTTLPEKCVWDRKKTALVYCAIPETLPRVDYPDAWYQGTMTFSDSLWKIDTATNVPERLVVPSVAAKETIDATDLFLSSAGDFLFFINKKDSSLWSLQVSI